MITKPAQLESYSTERRALSVSVVVPTRNRNADLECCLKAVSRLDPSPMEIVVVDSAPQGEGAREVAMRWCAGYVRENKPGLSRARNRGASIAHGDIIAYTDDDAAPDSSWLKLMVREFSDSRVALVVGKVVPPVAEPELDCLYGLCGFTGQSNDRTVIDRNTMNWFEKVNFMPFGLGPNLAVRKSVFQQWRGFDERIGVGTPVPGHEEQRAFLQLIDLGYRLVYTPDARVAHPLSARSAEELRLRSLRRMQASAAYLTLLMIEEPRYRHEVLGYIIRKLNRGVRRDDVHKAGQIGPLHRIMARLQGPWLYFKARSEHCV